VAVVAVHGDDRGTFYRQVDGVLASRPALIVDDGADLTATVHTRRRDLLAGITGATEVASTGVLRARNMAREGALAHPAGRQRRRHRAPVRQPLRHRPVHHRRHPPGHQRAPGRQGPGGRRRRLVRPRGWPRGPAVEERVARLELAALGVRRDDLTPAQEGYLRGWRLGT
jgi:S-adenosylhomocysteine hydrolase